jgi:hypothetical protein
MLEEAMQSPEAAAGFGNWWENAEWYEKAAVMIGIPVALMGIASVMFGEGGIGSMLAAVGGLGAAAYGTGMLNPALEGMGMTKWVQKPPEMFNIKELLGGKAKKEPKEPAAAGAPGMAPKSEADYTKQQRLASLVAAAKKLPPGDPTRMAMIRQAHKEMAGSLMANIPFVSNWMDPNLAWIKEQYGQLPPLPTK